MASPLSVGLVLALLGGEFQLEFAHYEELPPHLAEKVIKETKARKMAEHEAHG